MNNFAIISAFADNALSSLGNNAAVVYSKEELPHEQRRSIAADLHQPATSFISPLKEGHFQVYWYAPDREIGLCGHGSLAAGAFLNNFMDIQKATLHYREGHLKVGYDGESHFLCISPIEVIDHLPAPQGLEKALGVPVHDYFSTNNKDIVVLNSEADLRRMDPDFKALAQLEPFGYAVTALGEKCDFVSRTLVPKVQQLEDHATGSSHAALVPFWSERLMKDKMQAFQLSPRGGAFECEMHLNQVLLKGKTKLIISGNHHF